VHYDETGLFLLGAYRADGSEIGHDDLASLADRLDWPLAVRHPYSAISELLAIAGELPPDREGFVIRFADGLRLKVKGDEYCRIHRLVSRVTPLAMWEAMQAGDDLDDVRRQLPEEFWADFDGIVEALKGAIARLVEGVKAEADPVAALTDKEVGLRLDQFQAEVRRFIFPYRKSGGDLLSGRTRELVFRTIRPDANILPGYTPSYAMNRVMSEAA
jgi:RNA ligase